MAGVVIGVDPAKRSHAIEVIDGREKTLAAGVFPNSNECGLKGSAQHLGQFL